MSSFTISIQQTDADYTISASSPNNISVPPQPFPPLAEILTPEQQAILPRLAEEHALATSDEIRSVGAALYAVLFPPAIASAYSEHQIPVKVERADSKIDKRQLMGDP